METPFIAKVAQKYNLSEQEFREALFKTCINFNISEEDFEDFIYLADGYGLNPLNKEIYAVPKKNGIIPVATAAGWIKMIKSSPNLYDIKLQKNTDNEDNLLSVTCAMYLKGIKYPIRISEYLKECKQDTEHWRKYPARMLQNEAIKQCARLALDSVGPFFYEEDEAFYKEEGVADLIHEIICHK
ncbi:recombinase RecT [Bartonella schoenbuchensis]|uniref:Bacteriophage recombination protein n=1 Tax=Bartonella schoenbuchensis (strain DSM 13525 / NCTC 13165 / R1) TaxID=687861 RepID=E6Z0I6_BARSR